MAAEIGTIAPAFELPNQNKKPISSDSLRGRKSLVVFIPFPFTGVCEGELCLVRDHLATLAELDANVVAITCDTVPANRKWADENQFSFSVLSDFWPHGATAQAYGAFNEALGCANRDTFVLDEEGMVRQVISSEALGTPREFDLYTQALTSM